MPVPASLLLSPSLNQRRAHGSMFGMSLIPCTNHHPTLRHVGSSRFSNSPRVAKFQDDTIEMGSRSSSTDRTSSVSSFTVEGLFFRWMGYAELTLSCCLPTAHRSPRAIRVANPTRDIDKHLPFDSGTRCASDRCSRKQEQVHRNS